MINKYPIKVFLSILALIILNGFDTAFAQAPNIKYPTPPSSYPLNNAITALKPVNSGGAVPATIYAKVSTFAGSGSAVSVNGIGTGASFNDPQGLTIDKNGSFYTTELLSPLIRKISSAALVTTIAGHIPGNGNINGDGVAASFNELIGIAVDKDGNIYVADVYDNVIRKITSAGVVSTFAGSVGISGSANGTGSVATFNAPSDVVVDNAGNVYVADRGNNTIRKITPNGLVTTLAGNISPGSNDGIGTAASFSYPTYLTIDAAGNIYVSDTGNNLVRKITPSGVVTTIAGNGVGLSVDGTGRNASFDFPGGIVIDQAGNLYVGDIYSNLLRKITPTGIVSTIAGGGSGNSVDGIGKDVRFSGLGAMVSDGLGNLYFDDAGFNLIRKVVLTGYTIDKPLPAGLSFDQTTGIISGTPTVTSPATQYTITAYNATGSSQVVITLAVGNVAAVINKPIINYPTPNTYTANAAITPLTPTNTGGAVPATFFGLTEAYAGSGKFGATDGDPITASFHFPTGVASDGAGNLYMADYGNNMIRKINSAGVTSTFAGNGNPGAVNGAADIARFSNPTGVAVDAAGNVYVVDAGNNQIRMITQAGVVSNFAGNAISGSSNGTGVLANFNNPFGIAIDAAGNLYIADMGNNLIRKITPAGVVTTLAGSGQKGSSNGTGTAASFNAPEGIAVDAAGNVYVADSGNNLIREISPAGVVITIAGNGSKGSANGAAANASFNGPSGIIVDAAGNIFISDSANNLIRMITPQGMVTTLAGSGAFGGFNNVGIVASFANPIGLTIDGNGNLFVADKYNNQIRKVVTTGYYIDKPLPEGLVFDSSTGIISGTPTTATPTTVYTITAFNEGGNGSTTVSITVIASPIVISPPAITYQTPQVYHTKVTIAPLSPTNTGGVVPATVYGQLSTFVGDGNSGSANGTGKLSSLWDPGGITMDAAGNIYFISNGSLIRKATPQGVVTTIAGSPDVYGSVNGTGSAARFNSPTGIAVDAAGNLYVADGGNELIRKVTPAGVVTTFAGSGIIGKTDGTGTAASFDYPWGITIDAAGNLYVTDNQDDLIRKITPAGVVTTIAGNGLPGANNGTGTAASFNFPTGITVDASGNLYVVDTRNDLIRKITRAGVVSTFAGSGQQGNTDGPAASASFNAPQGIFVDKAGNVYVVDTGNNSIRMITPGGLVSTIGANYAGATGDQANFKQPRGIVIDNSGNAYVTNELANVITDIVLTGYTIDKPLPPGLVFNSQTGTISGTPTAASPATDYTITAYNAGGSSSFIVNITVLSPPPVIVAPPVIAYQTPQIYKVTRVITPLAPTNTGGAVPATNFGQVSTFAGSGVEGAVNDIGTAASFSFPHDVSIDGQGNLYVADDGNYKIRMITSGGLVSTLAGSGSAGASDGPGATASFLGPVSVTNDISGNIYVADLKNNLIRKITPAGQVSTLAGSPGVVGTANGKGAAASFNYPSGVAADANGNIYVADPGNNLIRKVTPDGTVSTLAGSGIGGAKDGTGTQTTFNSPEGIAVDNAGNIYVADDFNNMIRKITPAGVVTTLTGSTTSGSVDGQISAARFNRPVGVTVDAAGNIYVGDTGNNIIRMITPQGNVITLAGSGAQGSANGIASQASFYQPSGLTSDGLGNVFVADNGNHLIREVVATGYTIDKTLPAGLTFDPATGIISGIPTAISPATDYIITAYNAGGNSAFTVNIQVIENTLTPQVITFPAITSVTYGAADFDPGATSTNSTIPITYTSNNTDVATIINGKIHITGAGSSTITASQAGNDDYKAADHVEQVLTILPAPLIIAANNQTKAFGAVNPPLSITYTSFVYGETAAQLLTQPEISTTATTTSAPGDYAITITGGTSNNYDIHPQNGVLTITPVIVVPNAFTPNGDGINDLWNIAALVDFPQCLVSVYSRYGSLVYQSRGYAKPWDGTFNGSTVPTGTYYYIIDPKNGQKQLSGFVTVIR